MYNVHSFNGIKIEGFSQDKMKVSILQRLDLFDVIVGCYLR